MMYRAIAALCAFASCALIGRHAAAALILRYKLLRAFSEFLLDLRSEIRCGAKSLPEIFAESAGRAPEPLCELFRDLASAIRSEPGNPLSEHVRALNDAYRWRIPRSVRDALTYLSLTLGGADREGQLNALTLCEARIQRDEQSAAAELRNRCRTYTIAGICVGAAAAILIL